MSLSDPRVSGRKRLLSGLSRKGLHPKCEEEKYHRSPTGREKMLPSTRPHVDGCDPTGSVSKGKPFHCRANGRRRAEVSTQRWKKLLHCNIRRGRRILRAVRRETDGCEDALHRDELQENTEWRTWIPFRGWGKSSSLVPKDEHQENTKWKTWIPFRGWGKSSSLVPKDEHQENTKWKTWIPSRDWGKQHPENTKWLTWIPSREWGKSSSQMPMDVNGTWRARTLAEETGISENLYQSIRTELGSRALGPKNPHRMSLSDPRVSGRKRLLSGLSRKGLHPKCEEEKYHRSPTGREKMLPSTRPHVDGCDPTGSVSKGKPFHCRANGRRRAEVSTQRWKKLLHCNIRRGRRILRAVRRETDGCEDALHRDELQENTEWRTWIPFRGWGKSSSLVPKDEHQENTKWKTWIPFRGWGKSSSLVPKDEHQENTKWKTWIPSRDWGKQHPENTKWLTWIPSREWGKSSSQMPMDVNGTWRARTLAEETGISENLYQVTMFHV
ncbi:uncharacterized protein LOC129787703 [Lutzomyia longipalpis]|uniref:uncharacterized protein LOC129787703 n=1 Tax=Lutzomyia longipalpis TaxID=7200 RepID=UPI0024841035|nr:uncharacterized protein LOC129787703 [Lutzomyia longipalpis]